MQIAVQCPRGLLARPASNRGLAIRVQQPQPVSRPGSAAAAPNRRLLARDPAWRIHAASDQPSDKPAAVGWSPLDLFKVYSDPRCNRKLLALAIGQMLCSIATLMHDSYLPVYVQDELGLSNTKVGGSGAAADAPDAMHCAAAAPFASPHRPPPAPPPPPPRPLPQIGAVQGIAQFLCQLTKGVSGVAGDLLGSQVRVLVFGTFLTLACKPMFALLSTVYGVFGVTATSECNGYRSCAARAGAAPPPRRLAPCPARPQEAAWRPADGAWLAGWQRWLRWLCRTGSGSGSGSGSSSSGSSSGRALGILLGSGGGASMRNLKVPATTGPTKAVSSTCRGAAGVGGLADVRAPAAGWLATARQGAAGGLAGRLRLAAGAGGAWQPASPGHAAPTPRCRRTLASTPSRHVKRSSSHM